MNRRGQPAIGDDENLFRPADDTLERGCWHVRPIVWCRSKPSINCAHWAIGISHTEISKRIPYLANPRPGLIMLTPKQRLYHQIISFIGIGIYLFLLFGILALHEAVVSAKDGIEYHFYRFAIVNDLIFGKVILVAEDFRFAEWFRERRPIYAILVKSVAFTILLLIFDIVEEVVVGKFKGKTIGESFPHIGDGLRRSFSSLLSFLSH
jgi:hypothetical protein